MMRSVFKTGRTLRAGAMLTAIGALALTGCANFPEGDTTCPGQSPNSPDWPYCAPAEPGGPGPAGDRVDPSGPY